MKMNRPTEEKIQQRAYEIYVQRGCQPGHDIDDWLQAEYELMQLPIRKIAELPLPMTKKSSFNRSSLVRLVHAAILLGTAALPNLKR